MNNKYSLFEQAPNDVVAGRKLHIVVDALAELRKLVSGSAAVPAVLEQIRSLLAGDMSDSLTVEHRSLGAHNLFELAVLQSSVEVVPNLVAGAAMEEPDVE